MGNNRIWLIVALVLVVIGAVIFVAVMSANNWDFSKLGTAKFEENEHKPEGEFNGITVNTVTADLTILPSDDGECRVVCRERENLKHSVSVKDGRLLIQAIDERQWYHHIGVFGKENIALYLPEAEYAELIVKTDTGDVSVPESIRFGSADISTDTGDVTYKAPTGGDVKITTDTGDTEYTADVAGKLSISASTGDISIDGVSCESADLSVSTGRVTVTGLDCSGDLSLKVSTGKAKLDGVTCRSFISSGNTGDLNMKRVVASEKFDIKRSTGDVDFEGCDAAEIVVVISTGDVKGTLLTEKIFFVSTDTGEVEVPKSTSGGMCEITTSTGDVKLSIQG